MLHCMPKTWMLENGLLPVTVGVVVQLWGLFHSMVWLTLDAEAPLVERDFLDALPGVLLDHKSLALEFILSQ